MILDQFTARLCTRAAIFLLICVTVIDTAANTNVLAADTNGVHSPKTEPAYFQREGIHNVPIGADFRGEGTTGRRSASDHSVRYELSQNDKEVESADAKDQQADTAEEQGVVEEPARVMVFEPVQFCQGKFKRLGAPGVEIITVRCPKVDDSCNCEWEKKVLSRWVECGGVRKDSTVGSELLNCESKIVGAGAVASPE